MINAIIVDDEPAVASIICYFIEKEHLPISIVGVAENGVKALDIMKSTNVSLVFLDILMPFMNGFKVMENAPEKDYIIITAYDSFEYAQQALRLGAKDILLKPIDYKQFMQSVSHVIGWRFTSNDTLNKIIEFINENYFEKIDLTCLSNKFYISKTHVSRLFRQYMDTNTISYIHEIRIKKAVDLLEEGNLSIKEISIAIGYESLNNFYKYFKKYTGHTPATYVQKYKDKF
ncbi:MAG: helix-turn-helix domain-containing protein [Sedimentibacter sp.]